MRNRLVKELELGSPRTYSRNSLRNLYHLALGHSMVNPQDPDKRDRKKTSEWGVGRLVFEGEEEENTLMTILPTTAYH